MPALASLMPASGVLARVQQGAASVWAVDDGGELRGLDGRRLSGAELLPPVFGSKIIGLGYNYRGLMAQKGQTAPLIFLKGLNALGLDGGSIAVGAKDRVWIEVELGLVIAEGGRDIPAREAARHILGVVVANDVTAADPLGRDHHLALSKSRDGFCPVSTRLWRGVDVGDRAVEARINGRVAQASRTSDRFLSDAEAVSLVSRHITLSPGDLILTGTPPGAQEAVVRPGDCVEVRIEGLGSVRTTFTEEKA